MDQEVRLVLLMTNTRLCEIEGCGNAYCAKGLCKPCYTIKNGARARERSKQWYYNNREKAKKRIKQYALDNKEKTHEWARRFRSKNKEKIKEKDRRYYLNNKERIQKSQKEYYLKTKEAHRKRGLIWVSKNREKVREYCRRRYCKYSSTDITHEFLKNLWKETTHCEICGEGLGEDRHLDHIVPLNVQVMHMKSNVRYTHPVCNLKRPKDGSDL